MTHQCLGCGRTMSLREFDEQRLCNDCTEQATLRELNPDQAYCELEPDEWEQ